VNEAIRQPASYVHGLRGPLVIVPGRVAEILERRAHLNEFRVSIRGTDPELDAVLIAIRVAALQWRASATGSADAPPAEAGSTWLTTAEAAGIARITDRAIRQAIADGRLPATRSGRNWRIARVDLEQYRAARTT
jgi:excisionase family DNA binding protein